MTTSQTLVPGDPDDLVCDTCPNRYLSRGDMYSTFESARVRGWHIYQAIRMQHIPSAFTTTTSVDTRILCPECVGTPRSRLPAPPPVLEGQFDILAEMGIPVEPVQKEKKQPKKGVN